MPPSYTANNAVLVTPPIPAPLRWQLPRFTMRCLLLGSAAYGPITIAYTVNHADSSTESGTIALADWFSGQAPH